MSISTEDQEYVIDSIRTMQLARDLGCRTLGDFRKHMALSGKDISHWPDFAKTGADKEHLTKAGEAMIYLATFQKARNEIVEKTIQKFTTHIPTHRCKTCGAFWRLVHKRDSGMPDSWNLRSSTAGRCCDNVPMGKQIVPLTVEDFLHWFNLGKFAELTE